MSFGGYRENSVEPPWLKALRIRKFCEFKVVGQLRMDDIRQSFLKKIQVAMLTLGLLGVISFFFLYSIGEMRLPSIIPVEAAFITILIMYSYYRVFSSKTYDQRSTDIILITFFIHCIIVYCVVELDPLRVVWFQVFLSLVFLFKGARVGLTLTFLSLLVVIIGNNIYFVGKNGFYEPQLLWTFITSTIMISGAAAVMSRYYEALYTATYESSQKDGLTSALNSKSFREKCTSQLEKAESSNVTVVFCLIDLDNFKAINDKMGHLFGDDILVRFSDLMRRKLGENVLFGRLGGDEFSCFTTSEIFNQQKIEAIVSTTLDELSNKFSFGLKGSVGFSSSDVSGYDFNQLYRDADIKMYENKSNSKAQG
jgi:diguanylate cyclase (GGDEF)-like protein